MPESNHKGLQDPISQHHSGNSRTPLGQEREKKRLHKPFYQVNDPSAGSPTETLLRLLLPLNDPVRSTSQTNWTGYPFQYADPKASLSRSIGSSDGRCVQRAGTKSTQADDLRLLAIPRSRTIIPMPYPHHDENSQGCPGLSTKD